MKNFRSKFSVMCEDTLYAYQQGGFLRGDYVTIKKSALKNELVADMSEQMKSIISTVMKQGTNLRISYIKSGNSEAMNGPVSAPNVPSKCLWADVVIEYAPGMWKDPMTLPLSILDKVDIEGAEGYAPVNDDLKRSDRNDGKDASKVDQTKGDDKNRKLPTKNTKLANTSTPKSGDGSKKLGESIKMLRENDAIYEAYKPVTEGSLDIGMDTSIKPADTESGIPSDIIRRIESPEMVARYFSKIKLESPDKLKKVLRTLIDSGYEEQVRKAVEFQQGLDRTVSGSETTEGLPPEGAPRETTHEGTSDSGRFDDLEKDRLGESIKMLRENDAIYEAYTY